ncbi:hypothetical protein CerSpe_047870 [Prunus speciosa]
MERNQLQRQVALKRSSLFEQQFLDPQQFVQLEDLEDDANPNFVEEIVTLFYKDSARLFQKIEQTMQSRPIDFGKLDDYMHQFKGSSSSIGAIKVKNECSQFKEFCLAGNAEGCFWAFQRVKQEHHTLRIQLESYFQLRKQAGLLYNKRSYVASEDKKLELRLGPPGEDQSILSLGCIIINNNISHEPKRVCHETFKEKKEERESKWLTNSAPSSQCQQNPKPSHFQCPMISKPCNPGVAEFHNSDNKACSDPAIASEFTNPAAAHGSDQKSKTRIAQAAVVGWPPVRSSRKNLASCKSSFSKPPNSESPNEILQEGSSGKSDTNSKPHMFVKINMEGVPIGRKINLKAYDSYEKLSLAIDELFQGLLAALRVCSDVEKEDKKGETKSITHGNGEYTLLYEDHEGDRMLVGDVPWNMFVSTAKRLRVLKSSELSTLKLSSSQHEKTPLDTPMEVGK